MIKITFKELAEEWLDKARTEIPSFDSRYNNEVIVHQMSFMMQKHIELHNKLARIIHGDELVDSKGELVPRVDKCSMVHCAEVVMEGSDICLIHHGFKLDYTQ